ncbi:MAG TPA: PQQ-binding-like beta-propeller repeat protein [Flavobacteriales bacterium]|nr:PQQ-binding-like beta-propeller repeat protein [Flavobacteriales bacterium]
MKHCLRPGGLLLLLTGFAFNTFAQAPAFEMDMGTQVQWQRMTQFGSFIVGTPKGVKGVDPETGKVLWTTHEKYGNIPEDRVELIENSPFIALTAGTQENEDLAIIESFDGTVVFSSRDAGLQKVVSRYFLYQSGKILVLGTGVGSKTPSIHMVDMGTGKKVWSKESDFGIVTACKDLGNDEFLALTAFFVYRINAKTGDVVWKKPVDPKMDKMSGFMGMLDKGGAFFDGKQITAAIVTTPKKEGTVFIAVQAEKSKESTDSKGQKTVTKFFERNYMAFDINNGNTVWPALVNLPGKMGILVADEKGLVVSQGDGNDMNCLDYTTGKGLWGKKGNGISVKGGPLQGTAYIGSDLVIASGEKNNYIDILNTSTGESKLAKPVKVDGMVKYIEVIPAGILFATNEEVNIINQTTGEKVIAKSFKASDGLVTEMNGKKYVFNLKDNLLYEVDPSNGTAKALNTAPVEFQGKEDATRAEAVADGVVISSDQNIALIDYKGSVKFTKYFAAPRESGLKRALLYANAVYGAYATMVYGMSSAAFGAVSQSIQVKNSNDKLAKDVTGAVSNVYGDASKSAMGFTGKMLAAANKRFKATQGTNDYMYIMTEVAKKQYALVRVSKKTGETLSTIDLAKDKTPIYEIDGVENRVFYLYKDNVIRGYKF